MIVALLTLFIAHPAVLAAVTVNNPLGGQLPAIARVGANYTWSFSPSTFSTDLNQSLLYTASGLPSWCSFDNSTQTFRGVPSAEEEGSLNITVNASDSHSSAISSFSLLVTSSPPQTLQIPLRTQFFAGSSSLSSVFFLSPGSALKTDNVALRVPSHWSFSIGILGNTFSGPNDLYYAALRADGTPLPDWVTFDTKALTFNGITPPETALSTPYTLSINIHASDRQNYSAETVSFDLIVASHELYALSTLPTVNVTAETPFNFTVTGAADFTGILVNGASLKPENVTGMAIDVSSYKDWLQYNDESRTLFGIPPAGLSTTDSTHGGPILPANLTTDFNQTLETTISLAVVSSYFSVSDLGVVNADPSQPFHFDLTQFFLNKADAAQNHSDVSLSVTFSPDVAGNYLTFDSTSAQLSGQVPDNSQLPKVVVTFIAYSEVTHSTSHATLSVVSPQIEEHGPTRNTTTTIILCIVIAIIVALISIGVVESLLRRRVRVRGSTALAEEGALSPPDDKRRYHGIAEGSGDLCENSRNDDWSKEANASATVEGGSPVRGDLLGTSNEFFGPIKDTARNVSSKHQDNVPSTKLVIGYPRPLTPRYSINPPLEGHYVDIVTADSRVSFDRPSGDTEYIVKRASTVTSLVDSPPSFTYERSIPRRRADFGPRKLLQGPSEPAHATVKDHAHRSIVRNSIQSTSTVSYESRPETIQTTEDRPRLTPFIYGPYVPSQPLSVHQDTSREPKRAANQTASIDELSIGIHYVCTLGEDSSNLLSIPDKSFSSLASSQSRGSTPELVKRYISRFIVRTGERFMFHIPMKSVGNVRRKLEAKLMSGEALPHFLQLELKGHGAGRVVEFSGIPAEHDVGEVHVGVFNMEDDECLATVLVEIVGRNTKSPPLTV